MKKLVFTSLAIAFFLINGYGQTLQFEQVYASPSSTVNIADLKGVKNSDIAFADIDGDNDQDVLITGFHNSNEYIACLYVNDGAGNFTEQTETVFEGVNESSIAFADVDNDADLDLIITGESISEEFTAMLYINDGTGNYSAATDTAFIGISNGVVILADIDNDNDLDIFISGMSAEGESSNLYKNDGEGHFVLMTDMNIEAFSYSSAAFSDIDGDNDQDLLISGYNSGISTNQTYTNDGEGHFELFEEYGFHTVLIGSMVLADIDGDSDQDLLVSGTDINDYGSSKLYSNNGSGSFTEIESFIFGNLSASSAVFLDIDGDSDEDIILTGEDHIRFTKLFKNDGDGNFSLKYGDQILGVSDGSIDFADVDGDEDYDILITGKSSGFERISKLYINDGTGRCDLANSSPLEAVHHSSIALADVDGDEDQDLLLTGKGVEDPTSNLYINNGYGKFEISENVQLLNLEESSAAFSDIDGDNDQDIIIMGRNSNYISSRMYNNNGEGIFNEIESTLFDDFSSSSIAFSDVDGDEDQDFILIGGYGSEFRDTELYINEGNGVFAIVENTIFKRTVNGSVAFSDIDGDNDLDVLITGNSGYTGSATNLYINDGFGNYSLKEESTLDNVGYSAAAFADIDGDNDQDVIITGGLYSGSIIVPYYENRIAKLYVNDGEGNFTLKEDSLFEGVCYSSVAFTDIDGDNDQDLLIAGKNNSNISTTKLYINDSLGNYSLMEDMPFEGIFDGSIAIADIDADTDQDIILTGNTSSSGIISKIYLNMLFDTNSINEKLDDSSNIKVYPNPSSGIFSLETKAFEQLEIFDVNGKLIRNIKGGESSSLIDLSDQKVGVYMIRIISKGEVYRNKVIIK